MDKMQFKTLTKLNVKTQNSRNHFCVSINFDDNQIAYACASTLGQHTKAVPVGRFRVLTGAFMAGVFANLA